ncbi:hypothetical protein ASPACDRAFT_40117 [Aspergillus aculeatus ATCC 16872]|uniref:tRNA-splicing endonuclease subunit Sen15 domain-containing protein n=1 Tax=Aspergillus aculeatus (strain ATCC 16872 / CBS 172.66 / WB 5094) TaxID=690307 RepID=A0A1L9X3B9_ASPA1|nr:uncharacterized protein ASPACDRAFT_40117 [Aspergillus aculeatus ATCC 16872]OJK02804.1 hypothetical protein ASPACDRAFT_40117 [Aspergillus aculeatus ATCC 16872]
MTSTTTPSALTTLITSYATPTPTSPSSSNPTTTPNPNLNLNLNPKTSALTLQVLHNLQHQHLWTSLQIHELPSTVPTAAASPEYNTDKINLISGIPPHRLYTHPDEQFYLLERGLREEDLELERMFVIPTVQGHTWSLRRLAGVFDALPEVEDPGDLGGEVEDEEEVVGEDDNGSNNGSGRSKADKLKEYYQYRKQARATREWGGKRMLLAMVDRQMGGDSTVVYYVVQDGAVKPRQN